MLFKGNNSLIVFHFHQFLHGQINIIGDMSTPVTEEVNPITKNIDVASPLGIP